MASKIVSLQKALPSLQGFRIALTVAENEVNSPARQLLEREADLLYYPVSQILPPDRYDDLDEALKRCQIGEVNWLLLTTPCAVEAIAERLAYLNIRASDIANVKIAAYGTKTSHAVSEHFPIWQITLPDYSGHQEMVDAMQLDDATTVVLPVAQRSRSDWQRLLTATGSTVIAPPAYRLILGRGGDDLPGALWGGLVDAVVFLTENSVRHFAIRLKMEGGSLDMLGDVIVVTLDPQTAAAAMAYNLNVLVTSSQQSYDTLVDSLADYLSASAVEAHTP